jgi:hypothetical protein
MAKILDRVYRIAELKIAGLDEKEASLDLSDLEGLKRVVEQVGSKRKRVA